MDLSRTRRDGGTMYSRTLITAPHRKGRADSDEIHMLKLWVRGAFSSR